MAEREDEGAPQAGPQLAAELRGAGELEDLQGALEKKQTVVICGAEGAQKVWLAEALRKGQSAVCIVPEQKDLGRWEEDLRFFSPDIKVMPFPVVEKADFAVTFTGTEALRGQMQALAALLGTRPVLVLATAVEAAQKVPSPRELAVRKVDIHVGDTWDRDALLARLTEYGYERVDQVERCGHFAVRGDIVDVFAIHEMHPYRLEFWGDEIDGIRQFNEDDQRSIAEEECFTILPASIKGTEEATLVDYAQEALLVYDEPQRGQEQLKAYLKEERDNQTRCVPWERLTGRKGATLVFTLLNRKLAEFPAALAWMWKGQMVTNFQRQLALFADEVSSRLREGWRVGVVCAREAETKEIQSALRERSISWGTELQPGSVAFLPGLISSGFEFRESRLVIFSAGDVLGRQKVRRYTSSGKGRPIRFFSELHQGDYVVQRAHGIGRYMGLRTVEIDGMHRDYVAIQYAGGDKLYLPMEQISTLEKYIGPEGQTPVLSKMGGVQWEKIQSRTRQSIQELAEKLLAIYAKREITAGIAFDPDTAEQQEFEDTFPYMETEDQLHAIEEIKRAMERPEPMDMLLCGDVGFGKTEVAMRAVFKCVMSGYQSIVLVPTTVLARQHYQTFRSRMDQFGVHVAVLNRFCTAKERKQILNGMASGAIDVLIGTHAILSKKIDCRRLGLLVVDEEQRFGVVQKEKWKSRDSAIDVLTLSATPIPRTLHMSLTGVRDMVTITQAPLDRHVIQTYVTEYDDWIVQEAIGREKARGGQTYFIYNRIDSIDAMAAHLRTILPETISIGIAHGRMNGDQLEQVMMDFFEKKYDVLLCTTLIENGVDQPNANTLIVYDADHMGLSQLYQMRGRVGRSNRIARAYFFYRRGKVLSEVAEKRLESIREFTELGSGFKIAMRDLEIRGAGNLLGAAQHGNMAAVGFATYCTMLDNAIRRLKAEKYHLPTPKRLPDTVIEFMQEAYIDGAYIPKAEHKIEIYRRLALVSSEKELQDLIDEVIDRFGTPTAAVENLFAVAKLRVLARTLGIGSIVTEGDSFLITWADTDALEGLDIMKLPPQWLSRLRVLPGVPARVKIRKISIPEPHVKWLTEFLYLLRQEISSATSGRHTRA